MTTKERLTSIKDTAINIGQFFVVYFLILPLCIVAACILAPFGLAKVAKCVCCVCGKPGDFGMEPNWYCETHFTARLEKEPQ